MTPIRFMRFGIILAKMKKISFEYLYDERVNSIVNNVL